MYNLTITPTVDAHDSRAYVSTHDTIRQAQESLLVFAGTLYVLDDNGGLSALDRAHSPVEYVATIAAA